MRKWANLANAGELSIEQVLIELNIPLLFVCINKNDERYLVMCIDDEEFEYLFVQVDKTELIKFISTGQGLRELFTKAITKIHHVILTESLNDVIIAKSKIKKYMLPQKNVKYDFSNNDILKYLCTLNSISPTKKQLTCINPVRATPVYRPIKSSTPRKNMVAAKSVPAAKAKAARMPSSEKKQLKISTKGNAKFKK